MSGVAMRLVVVSPIMNEAAIVHQGGVRRVTEIASRLWVGRLGRADAADRALHLSGQSTQPGSGCLLVLADQDLGGRGRLAFAQAGNGGGDVRVIQACRHCILGDVVALLVVLKESRGSSGGCDEEEVGKLHLGVIDRVDAAMYQKKSTSD